MISLRRIQEVSVLIQTNLKTDGRISRELPEFANMNTQDTNLLETIVKQRRRTRAPSCEACKVPPHESGIRVKLT